MSHHLNGTALGLNMLFKINGKKRMCNFPLPNFFGTLNYVNSSHQQRARMDKVDNIRIET